MKTFVETERLWLREIVASDASDLFELDSNPLVHTYLGNKPVTSIEQSQQMIQHIRNQYQANGIGRWAIIDKATNAFMGWSGLKYETGIRETPYYDLGYRLKQAYWGKGIASEAARASLDYGFNQLALKEICAAAHVDNAASNAILKKLGFEWVETFRYDGAEHHWYRITDT